MRRMLLAGAAVATALAATLTTTATARAAETPSLTLPAPSGHQPVGRSVLHLKDEARADPWVPSEKRELMVSLWYPAAAPSATPAPYMTPKESALYGAAIQPPVPADLFAKVVTHATVDPRPVKVRGGLPLVVLSPGYGMPRATLTGLAEELASRGYAVAGIGHNYEADGIEFPDGHATSCVTCADKNFPKVGAVRAEDISFVLDRLTTAGQQPGVAVDPARIAVVGHSAGGFSTVPAMVGDPRVKAAVNMDGNFHFPNDTALDRPFLMLGKPSHVPGGPDTTWDKTWSKDLTGWKRWLTVDDTEHLSFTDIAPLAKQAGRPIQKLDGDRAFSVTRTYVTAFLDQHLRGRHAPLLDGPTACFPEVRFHQP
ncbi:alpha/beta hydrolase [Streptomyces sp. NBC_00249]|uniref:alpha/beta hydrolase family protein n=1 Tax=Streptomyces sp. NBC_00249 TaxID=2975690 RepID=UPI002255D040|nr:alpha/beta hydrolase [Streptomyces sp. NBC_00249]MCX5199137.1 alpha/beta hydrolase [Streptomyces sp. NBC_00249]